MRICVLLVLVLFAMGVYVSAAKTTTKKPEPCEETCFECGLDHPGGCRICARCQNDEKDRFPFNWVESRKY